MALPTSVASPGPLGGLSGTEGTGVASRSASVIGAAFNTDFRINASSVLRLHFTTSTGAGLLLVVCWGTYRPSPLWHASVRDDEIDLGSALGFLAFALLWYSTRNQNGAFVRSFFNFNLTYVQMSPPGQQMSSERRSNEA